MHAERVVCVALGVGAGLDALVCTGSYGSY
jgi:hypothetical protein